MAFSNSLAVKESWDCESVIRTPSTIGNVEKMLSARQPEVLCDWFQGTMHASRKDAVIARLSQEFGRAIDCTCVPKEMTCYRNAIQFADGAKLFLDTRYSDTCCVILSGKAEPTRHLRLIKELTQQGVRCTRIDLAFDDRRGVLAPSKVHRAIKSRQLVSRWTKSKWGEETSNKSGAQLGQWLQIGSKTSASYMSIYDKGLEAESESEGDWIRWELRLADKEAQEFVEGFLYDNPDLTEDDLLKHIAEAKSMNCVLCYGESEDGIFEAELSSELVDRFKTLALRALKERLSFRDRTTSLNTSRAMVLPWWEQFLEYFDPVVDAEEDSLNMDYEEGPSPRERKKGRESSTRRQVDEVLTAVYEQHIKPHKPSLAEAISRIPDYEDDDDGTEKSEDEILSLVGLQPANDNNVIRISSYPRPRIANAAQDWVGESARILQFRPKRSFEVNDLTTGQESRYQCRPDIYNGGPPT